MNTQNIIKEMIKKEKLEINSNYLIYLYDKIQDYLYNKNIKKPRKSQIFKMFIEYVLTRSRTNYDSMILITGDKGKGKSSAGLMICKFYCYLLGIKFDPQKHIVYSNAQLMDAIDNLPKFSPILCDESIDFASAQNWNKSENKKLKLKLGKIRTKHLFFVLCFPWKINKIDKIYFESYISYWIDIYNRGKGSVFVKDINPVTDPWKLDFFKKLGTFNEFTSEKIIEKNYRKHPNFWNLITYPKPSEKLEKAYLLVREKNIYNSENTKNIYNEDDIVKAFIILSFEDIFKSSGTAKTKRLVNHFKEQYNYSIKEKLIKECFEESKILVKKAIEEEKYNQMK